MTKEQALIKIRKIASMVLNSTNNTSRRWITVTIRQISKPRSTQNPDEIVLNLEAVNKATGEILDVHCYSGSSYCDVLNHDNLPAFIQKNFKAGDKVHLKLINGSLITDIRQA